MTRLSLLLFISIFLVVNGLGKEKKKRFQELNELEELFKRLEAEEKNTNDDVCAMPKEVGDCKAAFPRFYYDATTGACEEFIYGGCQGNENNFETLEECYNKCSKK